MYRRNGLTKENRAVCIGRFEYDKRFDDVLQAMSYLKGSEIKISLLGFSQDENRLIKAIRDLGLKDNVELLVNVNREILIECLGLK